MALSAEVVQGKPPVRIGIVAGEASGDILGAGLIDALRQHYPDARFEGIGGPRMEAAGFHSLFPMERLSVMGLVEVLGRLRELLGIRRQLRDHFLNNPPDLFVGIDAPDFNLGLELMLRQRGIRTAHYVSPSVWAWRQGRVKKIARACDLMLCLFPFESEFYQRAGVPVRFVGHPLADQLPMQPDQRGARAALGIAEGARVVALLPGSRGGEVAQLGAPFLQAARWCLARQPDLEFLVPAANDARRQQLQALLQTEGEGLPIRLLDGQSREAMAAADAVLLASGTATLEALLLKRPMVVAYRMAPLTFRILSWLVRSPAVSLPNLLAGRTLVPELLQEQATPQALGEALLAQLGDSAREASQQQAFAAIHRQLRRGASEQAADALRALLAERGR